MAIPAVWRSHASALPLLTAKDAADGDAYAITNGDSASDLMWTAAGHLARTVVAPRASGYGRRVVIIVGKGNNGGDGYAAALRLTISYGAHVTVVALDGTDVKTSPETAAFRAAWSATNRVITDLPYALAAIDRADVVVDAVLGTGASGPFRGSVIDAVGLLAAAKQSGKKLVACDAPTGVDVDTGQVQPGTVAVQRTVTFGAFKRGVVCAPAAAFCGTVTVGSLGANWDTFVAARHDGAARTGWPAVALTVLGARPHTYTYDVDKWQRGRIAVIAGVAGTAGAATLTAHGALHAGAGLVHVYAGQAVADEIASSLQPEVMLNRLGADDVATGDVAAPTWVTRLVRESPDVVVAGPGLGVSDAAKDLVGSLLGTTCRLVLDADALNVLRDNPKRLADHAGTLVITPHRKELARIGGGDTPEDAWDNRMERVPKLAVTLNAIIVAKGPSTLVAAPDGRVWVTPVGSPAAGTAGSGDLLAGVIAAAIATSCDPAHSVAQAVWWHARASEQAGQARAGRATAGHILHALGPVFAELHR